MFMWLDSFVNWKKNNFLSTIIRLFFPLSISFSQNDCMNDSKELITPSVFIKAEINNWGLLGEFVSKIWKSRLDFVNARSWKRFNVLNSKYSQLFQTLLNVSKRYQIFQNVSSKSWNVTNKIETLPTESKRYQRIRNVSRRNRNVSGRNETLVAIGGNNWYLS